ncbi:hypothetical protein PLEOSDRAFT_1087493 [Pleurotus ostreatus PC15]|uniref:Uncharacterized protein n=1 Tax=Pleurotus ostreatus (strain PC15) TaxID=1137138 RepID=A0A067NX94_PLEO1|nr:hypothetical protein PLEOSDRAFT_1087493 [Pleurotus ostreatus PC15]
MSLSHLKKLVSLFMPRISWLIPTYRPVHRYWRWLCHSTIPSDCNPGDGHICQSCSDPASKEASGEKVTAAEEKHSRRLPDSTDIESDNDNRCSQHGLRGDDQQQHHRSSLMVDSFESLETLNEKRGGDRTKSSSNCHNHGRRPRNEKSPFPTCFPSDCTLQRQVPHIARRSWSSSHQRGLVRVTTFAPKLRCEPSDESRKAIKNAAVAPRFRPTDDGYRRGSW